MDGKVRSILESGEPMEAATAEQNDIQPFLLRTRSALTLPSRFWLLTIGATGSILALRFVFDTSDRFGQDLSGVDAYISAIGVLYGILAAFTIFVVWTQFNEADAATDLEVKELIDLFRFGVYLRDVAALEDLQSAITEYARSVADEEWAVMATSGTAAVTIAKFERIFQSIHSVRFDDERDESAWTEMIRKYESISDARNKRLQLARTKLPPLLRGLLYVVSLTLVLGFFMLGIGNDFLAVVVTASSTAIVFLAIEVVEDLDDPFGGQWALSSEPFKTIDSQMESIVANIDRVG